MSINKFLTQIAAGDSIRDYAHASRTFVDDVYALQPRHKHLFHVVFNFAPGIPNLDNFRLDTLERGSLHLLVKSADLPQFDIDVQDKNQYNRHRYTQHKVNYGPVTINFHDDQSDLIRKLWYSYYIFYYQDGLYETNNGSLTREHTVDDIYSETRPSHTWGMDRGPLDVEGKKFFSDIRIYSMFQKQFIEHILVNPIITSFRHDSHDYATSDLLEHQMQLQYETVLYGTGTVNEDYPQNFAVHHYDKNPSPISPLGGGTNSMFGKGGLLDSASAVAGHLGKGNILGAVLTGGRTIYNAKDMNIKRVITDEIKQAGKDFLRNKNPTTIFSVPKLVGAAKQLAPVSKPSPKSGTITSQKTNIGKASPTISKPSVNIKNPPPPPRTRQP